VPVPATTTASTPATGAPAGLSAAQAAERLRQFGPNALQERKVSPLWRLFGYFWGPIPWMIEAAAVLSALVRHWADFWIILALLIFNAGVGFWQEFTAGNAVAALKKQLAMRARVLRDGAWQEIDAQLLVPGDVVRIRLGDVIPADVKLAPGGFLSVDQSALTGESLPVTKQPGDEAYSGTVVKQGEVVAEVSATGPQTKFGKTAGLVEQAHNVSHFQRAVLTIGDYLIYVSVALVVILVLFQLHRHSPWLDLVQFALILTVASIPVAMPAVLSMTMAVGAMALSRRKAIVTRLESIEEMASMDVLCSDKTGTLTQNRLTLGKAELFHAADEQALLVTAALASKAEDQDAIDQAVLAGLTDREQLETFRQTAFVPFDPVHKRTEATIEGDGGRRLKVTKGAPQVIMQMSALTDAETKRAQRVVDAFAERGYRTLGVASQEAGASHWTFLGILSLFDPPRDDSAATIASARAYGVDVKMVTGDNAAIAKQIAGKLGLGTNILPASALSLDADGRRDQADGERVEKTDGFAEVFPEHKFAIVKLLQARNHVTGMTGDGVNDAPALKQADVGIAVSGATDAARAAADLVLTAPGLSVIINAIEEARRIFERMNAYAVYRISETIRIMLFVVLTMIFFNFYPITAIMIILLAFFNDVPIMTIAFDRTDFEKKPVRWDMRQVITVATAMGVVGVIGSFGMLLVAMDWLKLAVPQVQTYVFLKMAVAGHLVLFAARSKEHMWKRPWPAPVMVWSAVVTKVAATIVAAYGFGLMTPISWPEIAFIWGYSILSALMTDFVKVQVYRQMQYRSARHRGFFATLQQPLHVPGHGKR
jgi:H+-transporting ATPase